MNSWDGRSIFINRYNYLSGNKKQSLEIKNVQILEFTGNAITGERLKHANFLQRDIRSKLIAHNLLKYYLKLNRITTVDYTENR